MVGLLTAFSQCLQECWKRDPEERPDFETLEHRLIEVHTAVKGLPFRAASPPFRAASPPVLAASPLFLVVAPQVHKATQLYKVDQAKAAKAAAEAARQHPQAGGGDQDEDKGE